MHALARTHLIKDLLRRANGENVCGPYCRLLLGKSKKALGNKLRHRWLRLDGDGETCEVTMSKAAIHHRMGVQVLTYIVSVCDMARSLAHQRIAVRMEVYVCWMLSQAVCASI